MATYAPLQHDLTEFRKAAVRTSTSHSRSTSAGSAPSDGRRSIDLHRLLQDSPASTVAYPQYPQDTIGLPEYEYPAPWTLPQAPQLPEADFGATLIVKNTFLGFGPLRTPSFDEFYEERMTQSCPASGIRLPPGLEDTFEPEETRTKLLHAEAALQRTSMIEAVGAENVMWPAEHLIPSGLLDLAAEPEPHQILSPPQQQTPGCGFPWQAPMVPPASFDVPQQPMVLDLQAALDSAAPSQQPAVTAELGSLECPTIGSQGHWYGTCRPCAFLYTKGCGNGVSCEFCHLCDAGEKKRRQRDKRALFRAARTSGY